LGLDECGRFELGEAQFGILVEVAADGDEFIEELGVHPTSYGFSGFESRNRVGEIDG
jgi:hypothetical protein